MVLRRWRGWGGDSRGQGCCKAWTQRYEGQYLAEVQEGADDVVLGSGGRYGGTGVSRGGGSGVGGVGGVSGVAASTGYKEGGAGRGDLTGGAAGVWRRLGGWGRARVAYVAGNDMGGINTGGSVLICICSILCLERQNNGSFSIFIAKHKG